jgi:hypothetical protein
MKNWLWLVALVVVGGVLLYLATLSSPESEEMTEAEIAQIEAEVREWADEFLNAWSGDTRTGCEANLVRVHPDHVVFLRGGEPRRKADWLDWCLNTNEGLADFIGEWTDRQVRVLSPDAAVFIGRWSGTFVEESGRSIHHPAAAQRMLLERMADGWGMTFQQWSNGPSEVTEEG